MAFRYFNHKESNSDIFMFPLSYLNDPACLNIVQLYSKVIDSIVTITIPDSWQVKAYLFNKEDRFSVYKKKKDNRYEHVFDLEYNIDKKQITIS